jgi:hypothetical protein
LTLWAIPPVSAAGDFFQMTSASRQEQIARLESDGRFTRLEIEHVGRLINGLGIMGCQILFRSSDVLNRRAYALLQKIRQQEEPILRRLDQLARLSNDESALKLIDDLGSQHPNDAVENLKLARRCLAASAFLGHCIVLSLRSNATFASTDQARSVH